MRERAVRCLATWYENGQPKFVEGRVYPLSEETERLVLNTIGQFVEVDRTVEKLQLATIAAREAEALLAGAEARHAQAAEVAKAAQNAVVEAVAMIEAEDSDKPQLIEAVRVLIEAKQAADLAAETSSAARVAAAAEADDAGIALGTEERKKRAETAAKAANALAAAQGMLQEAGAAAAALGEQLEIDAITAAIEITRA